MKRNGFTLVEMMAVIVLIALLAVIGVATYTNVNESAKQKTLESKKEQIRTSAIKWAKENNISNKTIISVNALVVEGYLTAEENEVGKIGVIENPVTGENMICNTVDISLKEGEYIAAVNDTEQNCTLATQSLVDTNISIKVVDEKNIDKTGSASIAAWTNQNVMIIVSSSSYDSRMTSISYDFEGNTITKQKSGKQKYTGNAYISEAAAANYYNVFHINAALILNSKVVVTYNIAGENSKSRAYTIRIDKEEASANVSSNSEWLTVDKDVYVTVDDGKGSGPKYFYINKDPNINTATRKDAGYKTKLSGLEIGKYYIWTEDIAGNKSAKYKVILELNNVDKTVPACEVIFHGNQGYGGWYKEVPVTPGAKNTVPAGISGMNIGINTTESDPEYTVFAPYNEYNEALAPTRNTETSWAGVNYFCHVKTLSGNYANSVRNLKLDMTPPTVTVYPTSETGYSKDHLVVIDIEDSLSGMPNEMELRYGWGLNGNEPTQWFGRYDAFIRENDPNWTAFNAFDETRSLTGIYWLYVDYSTIRDYAGNYATKVNGMSFAGKIAKFGPFMFDNTPPVCDGNNGKTNWTAGSYTINQYCIDNDGTDDQSGCEKRTWTTKYLDWQTIKSDEVIITDKAGNSTTCPYDVYLDNTKPVCVDVGGKKTWTKGTYTVEQKCKETSADQSGCAENPFKKDYTTSQTVKTDTIQIKDNVGNTRTCDTNIYLDNTAPSCSLSEPGADGNNGWYKSKSVTITASHQDNGDIQSGVSQKGTAKTSGSTNGNTSVKFTENGASLTAHCYVKDTAGNEGSNSLTFKKDDGSEMGNCKILYGNTSWKIAANITVGVELGSKPISGCNDGYNCTTKDEYPIHDGEAVKQANTSGNSSVLFMSNSGVTYSCPNGPHNIYSDRQDPTCSFTKTVTESTSGVSATLSCSDGNGSGVKSCNGGTTSFSGLKSGTSATVTDNLNHSGSCSISVTSYDCNCETCTGTTCVDGWTCTGGYSCTGTAANCTGEGCPTCSSFTTKSACNGNTGCSWTCGGWTCNGYNTYACNCDTCYK